MYKIHYKQYILLLEVFEKHIVDLYNVVIK